jgi:phosphatidylethanolamine/phosphatidyl-N-methylethanolamine N-methyltransferase
LPSTKVCGGNGRWRAVSELRKALAEKFDDELKFFRGWIDKPKAVGSIVPTSSITARQDGLGHRHGLRPCPCSSSDPAPASSPAPSSSAGVKPDNLYCVEYSEDFVRHLRRNHPASTSSEGDAFNLDKTLGEARGLTFDSVVSGVPLLNFPVALSAIRYIEDLLGRIPAGRPVVQLTYGPLSPVPPGRGNYTVERFHFILRNIPPTQLWIYRRPWST